MKTGTRILILSLAAFLAVPAIVCAQGTSQAKVLEIIGEAKYMSGGAAEWAILDPEVVLKEGDRIKTASDSQVRLELTGHAKTAELIIRKETEFTLQTFRHEDSGTEKTLLDVAVGSVLVKAEKLKGDSKFEVKTPTSIVGIRGTTFEVQVSKT